MRKTAWIWALGCVVWVFDASVHGAKHDVPGTWLGVLMAVLFFAAWVFFRNQRRG